MYNVFLIILLAPTSHINTSIRSITKWPFTNWLIIIYPYYLFAYFDKFTRKHCVPNQTAYLLQLYIQARNKKIKTDINSRLNIKIACIKHYISISYGLFCGKIRRNRIPVSPQSRPFVLCLDIKYQI